MMRKNAKSLDNTINFYTNPTAATSGIYEIYSTRTDTYPIYYYRGIVSNNNIKFAEFCWKIVRTTETGGVKLIYNGKPSNNSCDNTGTASQIGTSVFNSTFQSSVYIVYVSNGGVSTTIKNVLDNWYSSYLSSYASKIEDTKWCIDQTSRGDLFNEGKGTIYYESYYRNFYLGAPNPTVNCSNTLYNYTVSTSKGNGRLRYPIGLLTADELTLAGNGRFTSSGYLKTGQSWWVNSPNAFAEARDSYVFRIDESTGSLTNIYVALINTAGVRPSISLAPGVVISGGTGEVTNPYTIVGG